MLIGVDDTEVDRAERRLQTDRLAFAEGLRQFKHGARRTLTRPSTLAMLLVAGGIAGARSKPHAAAAGAGRIASIFRGIVRTVWAPLLKSVAAFAVERVLHGSQEDAAPPRRAGAKT